jgi:predicted glycosyltransferase
MKVWIDIDNPPQVQYLVPFRAAFEAAGAQTVITARDYGATVAMLEDAGVSAQVFGARVGRGRLRKLAGLVTRARDFGAFFARTGRPDVLLAASRPSAVAARRLGIPSFIVGDYEYANVSVYRLTGSTILHPDVIDAEVFRRRGLRARQVVGFRGVKEDLTFAGVDVDAIAPHDLGPTPADAVRVLFRPPSETSHYYDEASSAMARATLRHLAEQGALVVYSPREPGQLAYLDGLPWRREPIVLRHAVPFVSLLKSVDAIVCAGGTMLREAAYLGIPAYSIFRSEIGGVDRWLERIGRAALLSGPEDLPRITLRRRGPLSRLDSNPRLLDELVALIAASPR